MFNCEQCVKIIFTCVIYLNLCRGELTEGEVCKSNDGLLMGKCTSLMNCENALELIDNGISPTFCNSDFEENFNPLACCFDPNELNDQRIDLRQRISLEMCQKYSTDTYKPTITDDQSDQPELTVTHKIQRRETLEIKYFKPETEAITYELLPEVNREEGLNGDALTFAEESFLMEFPHMALVGIGTDFDNFRWICGGSLISEKFVLTAAHCIHNGLGPVQWVRLGELDTMDPYTSEFHRDFLVARAISHPNYEKGVLYHDIGLLELDRFVNFTEHINPACLYQSSNISFIQSAIATGWGRTSYNGQTSTHLMKADLDLVNNRICNDIYQNSFLFEQTLPYRINESMHICAGGNEKKSHCEGDSGGPLQIKKDINKYDIIGIISFGLPCGSLDIPGVFTRVDFYLDWIEDIVWP